MKKFVALLALITVVGVGAFAQITFGMSGALHMDEKLSASELKAMFDEGYHFKHVDTIFARVFGDV